MIVKIEKREGFFRKYFPLVLEYGMWRGLDRFGDDTSCTTKVNIELYCGRWTKKGAMKALEKYKMFKEDSYECVYENQNF